MQHEHQNTLYVIHGWGLDSRVMAGLVAELDPCRNIRIVDMPGYGNNPRAFLKGDIDTVADNLASTIPSGSVLLGWSLGGMVAIKIASKYCEKIRAIILLASTPCFVKKNDWPHGIDQAQIQKLAEHIPSEINKAMDEFIYLTARGDETPRKTIRELKTHFNETPPDHHSLLEGLAMLRDTDLRGELSGLPCHVIMLLAEHDHLVARDTGDAVKILCPSIHLDYIQASGHAPFISRKSETAKMIISGLKARAL